MAEEKLDQWSAASHGNYKWFIHHDINSINKKDHTGRTSLYYAAEKGHISIVLHLILHNADINCLGSHNNTPLHVAVLCCHGNVVQCLVGFGCNRNIKNSYGHTAADGAKNNQIKEMILYPNRGNTQRFEINRRELPAFLDDSKSLVGCNALWKQDINRRDVIKELKKISTSFASELEQIITESSSIWNHKLIYFYTLESPLYKKMNADLAAVNKLSSSKLYANALAVALSESKLPRYKKDCYRSVHLNSIQIQAFKKKSTSSTHYNLVSLPAFSSCTKSKKIALEWGGNVLMVIHPPGTKNVSGDYADLFPDSHCAVDISSLSIFNEEEVLLKWSTQLCILEVKQVSYSNSNVKYEIEAQITSVGG